MSAVATWYFDVISPYVYLQLADLDRLPPGITVAPKPVLFAGLLGHWGNKGPAEIAAKRIHTYRQCAWLAQARGIPFRMPPAHPFNPLAALRLLCALGPTIEQARIACDFVFGQGNDPSNPEGLRALARALGADNPEALTTADATKAKLRANTDEALARGVWGVPTFDVGGQLFWGADSFSMMLGFLANPHIFDTAEMRRIETLPTGATRSL